MPSSAPVERAKQIQQECLVHNARLALAIKTQTPEKIRSVCFCPSIILAENRIQEAIAHFPLLADLPNERHFIGRLQKNKVKKAVELFDVIESVDSLELLEKISMEAEAQQKKQRIFLSVNISRDETKSGFFEEEIASAIEKTISSRFLVLEGFFTILKWGRSPQEIRADYRKMKLLFGFVQQKLPTEAQEAFTELSMGMSGDYAIALEEGASIVRIGRGIFGEREGG